MGAGAHGCVFVEFHENAADAEEQYGAELGVLGDAGDGLDAFLHHFLDEHRGTLCLRVESQGVVDNLGVGLT